MRFISITIDGLKFILEAITPLHTQATQPKTLKEQLLLSLYHPYKLLIYLPIFLISTLIFGSIIAILVTLGNTKSVHRLPVLWARLNVKSALCHVRVTGQEYIDDQQSYVIVANHRSHFDVLAIYGWLKADIRWVMKQELRAIPALGIACEKLGHIFVARGSNARASMDEAKRKLNNGTSVFFFPEGSRSTTSQMLPFKRGAFHLAKTLDLPILPITINGSERILPAKSLNLLPGNMEIIIHQPVFPGDFKDTEHSHTVRQTILKAKVD